MWAMRANGPRTNRSSEDDMNDNQTRRGPSPALLLLIPAALIIAKGARRRREMWMSGGGYGHRHGFAGGGPGAGGRAEFRLPPKLEWMLDSWHTRAHETASAATPTATDPATA
jgi:hypothetical protein